jgi:hypothetical protein
MTESKATLQSPGNCVVCGRMRSASVEVAAATSMSRVYCSDHAANRTIDPGTVFIATLEPHGAHSVWARPDAEFNEATLRLMMRALLEVSVAREHRAKAALRETVGPWRLLVTPDGLVAPRPPGQLSDQSGRQWPMVKARLGRSKWARKCVQCQTVLADVDVFRADAKAGARTSGGHRIWEGWSTHDVSHCIVCLACVGVAQSDHDNAGRVVVDIFAEMIKASAPR